MSKLKLIKWKNIIERASYYKGTIENFCKENNISVKQFYYYTKKIEMVMKYSEFIMNMEVY